MVVRFEDDTCGTVVSGASFVEVGSYVTIEHSDENGNTLETDGKVAEILVD